MHLAQAKSAQSLTHLIHSYLWHMILTSVSSFVPTTWVLRWLISLSSIHDILFSIQQNKIADTIKDYNNLQKVVKYANMPISGAFCFLFPSLYKNVNNLFLNHPHSHLFTNNSDLSGAFSKKIIWYVPKRHGESILLDLKSMMVKIEYTFIINLL